MAVMFLHALLTSVKLLTKLITSNCLESYWMITLTPELYKFLRSGILNKNALLDGVTPYLLAFTLVMVRARGVYFHLICFPDIYVI